MLPHVHPCPHFKVVLLPAIPATFGMCIQVFKEDKEVLRAVLEGNPSEIDAWRGESVGARWLGGHMIWVNYNELTKSEPWKS